MQPVFRFAPSPTGRLHAGHAYSALLNRRLADRLGGRLLLRIEDIDPARRRPEHIAGIVEDLDWLGVGFDAPVLLQSARLPAHGEALARLSAMGLVYACRCSRLEIRRGADGCGAPRDPDGAPRYPGVCRTLALPDSEGAALRLSMAAAIARAGGPPGWRAFDPATGAITSRAADPARWGDVVLRRKDAPTSYHLGVVVDDAHQGVTHVVRGRDLEAATDLHALLQALLGLPAPLYHHHDLVSGGDGEKLSKSKGSPALADLRAAGARAQTVIAALEPRLRAACPRP
jgi:glutamyl-Q tRNA(Asp) synthetase